MNARVHDLLVGGMRAFTRTDARREAEILLAHVLGVSRAWLVAHADDDIDDARCVAFRSLVARCAAGEPVAYLVGTRGFRDLELYVTPDVLIPRPETELLVELALQRVPAESAWRIADLGTGSGAVALSIARARPLARVLATDASESALAVARRNASRNGIGNIAFANGDWCAALGDSRDFDLIVSNPPYIATGDPHLRDLRFEPRSALVSGGDGLDAIRAIVRDARAHLRDGGWLLFEHGFSQGDAVRTLLGTRGYGDVFTARDLEGRERVSGGHTTG